MTGFLNHQKPTTIAPVIFKPSPSTVIADTNVDDDLINELLNSPVKEVSTVNISDDVNTSVRVSKKDFIEISATTRELLKVVEEWTESKDYEPK